MAENNKSLMTPEQAQQLQNSGALTADTASALFPATAENQTETEEAVEKQASDVAAKNQAVNAILSETKSGIANEPIPERKIAKQMIKNSEQAKEQAAIEEQARQESLNMQKAQAQTDLVSLKKEIAYLEAEGLPVDAKLYEQKEILEDQALSYEVAEASAEQRQPNAEAAIAGQANLANPNEVQNRIAAEDNQTLEEKTLQKKDAMLEQLSTIMSEQQAMEVQRLKLLEEQQAVFNDVEEIKKQAKDTQLESFWDTASTGNQILAAIAIGLEAVNNARDPFRPPTFETFKIINNITDRQMKQKQLSFENQLALKDAVLDKTSKQLQVINAQTNSQQKKLNIVQMQEQIRQQQAQIQQQLEAAKKQQRLQKLVTDGSLTEQQSDTAAQMYIAQLDPKKQEKAIYLGKDNGGVQIIQGTPGEVKDIKEQFKDSKTIMRDLDELESLVDQVGTGEQLLNKVSFGTVQTEDVRAAEQITNSIVGKLRLEILGPGVMTPAERELVKSIIGNPNKLLTTDAIEKNMIRRLRYKIEQGMRDRLRSSGVILPTSKNEQQIQMLKEQAKKDGIKFDRAKAINFLIDKNRWN